MEALSGSAVARDIAHAIHPFTDLKRHQTEGPLVISRAEGIYIYDQAGRRYLDGMAGLGCVSLGYGESRLADVAEAAMRRLPFYHQCYARAHEPGIALAERLIEMAPAGMSKVLFTNSGSEATDTMVKLIWYTNNARGRPGRKKIICRDRSFHGVTVASTGLCGIPEMHADFDLPLPGILHTDCPNHYRHALPGESEEDFATRCAENLEKLILAEGPDTVAAFLTEPVQSAGGCIMPPATYWAKIQAVLRRYDVLFACDEVITGFGRTGNTWGADTYGLKPDMMSVAKALSSAYLPIAAVMISAPIYDALVAESEKLGMFAHGFTSAGHPVSASVALETLRIYRERDVMGHAHRVSPAFQDGLRRFADHPLVGDVRGHGLIGGAELVRDKATKQPFDPADGIDAYCRDRALAHGLVVRVQGGVASFTPPIVITEDEIAELLDRFGRALDDTLAMVRERGLLAA